MVWSPCFPRNSQEFSLPPQFQSINSSALNLLYDPTLTSVHDYWKNQSFDHTYICWQTDVPAFNMLSRFAIAFCPRSMRVCVCVFFLNFMLQSPSTVILESKRIKICHCFHSSPFICHEVMGPDAMILVFWMISFKPAFSLSYFTFIKSTFSSSLLSAIRVVLSTFLKLLAFLLEILIPSCDHPTLYFAWCTLHRS